MPRRSRRVAVVAHCHLNVNAKVCGLAQYAGARDQVISPLVDDGTGIVQLPCPETTFLGMKRWGMTVEQYDIPAYRRHCRDILWSTVDTLVALRDDGCAITAVIGVEGSPSCGVATTCTGYAGGEIEGLTDIPHAQLTPGRGVFIEEFSALLHEAGLDVPFTGVPD